MEEQQAFYESDASTRVRDLEEKMRLLKDRVILIGQNLLESRESLEGEVQEIKVMLAGTEKDLEKLKEKVQLILEEFEGFSRKEEVNLLKKQFKMFEPLQFARIDDVKRIVEEELAEKEGKNEESHSLEKDKRGYIR